MDLKMAYVRNFVFGVEDSLVSTVGLVAGIAVAGVDRLTIVTTGIILIFVEAFSMAVGSFLSEESAEEYEFHKEAPASKIASTSLVMFFSYFISGFIPLFPYAIWETNTAFVTSIIFSILALTVLGYVSAKVSKAPLLRTILRMALLGGLAIAIGVLVGNLLSSFQAS